MGVCRETSLATANVDAELRLQRRQPRFNVPMTLVCDAGGMPVQHHHRAKRLKPETDGPGEATRSGAWGVAVHDCNLLLEQDWLPCTAGHRVTRTASLAGPSSTSRKGGPSV